MTTEFTPFLSLSGGVLIGLSAVMLMWTLGRIMGATGILAGVVMPSSLPDWTWRASVVIGMLAGPWLFRLLMGEPLTISVPSSTAMILVGGLFVGVGVTLGSGCTSGHGVCGLARLSGRSIASVLTFMVSTAATVFITRHILGL